MYVISRNPRGKVQAFMWKDQKWERSKHLDFEGEYPVITTSNGDLFAIEGSHIHFNEKGKEKKWKKLSVENEGNFWGDTFTVSRDGYIFGINCALIERSI